jgi:hypothetical protein
MRKLRKILNAVAVINLLWIGGCSVSPPSNPDNLCSIFQEKDSWYNAALRVHEKYGVPMHVAMAIMAQESRFKEDAKPPMRWFLFIPYGRGSSSLGYAQAQDAVWSEYVSEDGNMLSSRTDFEDSLSFIAWYMTKTKQKNNVNFLDAFNQFLNYHEGWYGYANKSYLSKKWLIDTARTVHERAEQYKKQLNKCKLY